MASTSCWWKGAEDAKPEYDEAKLKSLKEKADKVYTWRKTRKPVNLASPRTIPGPDPSERVVRLSEKISAFREKFQDYRKKKRSDLSMYRAKCRGNIGLVAQIYSITGRWTYQLKNYKPITIAPERKQQYELFDQLWLSYDKDGSGMMSYAEFEKFKTDVGFRWADCPSPREIDPSGSGMILFEDVCRWWFSKEHLPAYSRAQKRSISTVEKEWEKSNADLMERYAKRQRFTKTFRQKRADRRKKHGKRKRNFVLEISTSKKQKLEYDVSNYKPLDIDDSKLKQVNVIWMNYDKDGTGKISKAAFQKLVESMGKDTDAKVFEDKEEVVFEDFVNWWFGLQKPADKKAPSKRGSKKLLSAAEVKKLRQKFAEKFAIRSKAVKDKVKNSPMPKSRTGRRITTEIFAGATKDCKKISYDITNYAAPYVPREFEAQERHLDLIWKNFEKAGTGKLTKEEFGKFVESFGSKVEDEKVLSSLQDSEGFITWEKFDAWWFSKDNKAVVPMAPPAPKDAVRQKVSDIRKSVKAVAEKQKSKYNGKTTEAELKERVIQYSAKKQAESAKFRQDRIAKSPKKGQRKLDQLKVDIFSKKAGNIEHLSFVA